MSKGSWRGTVIFSIVPDVDREIEIQPYSGTIDGQGAFVFGISLDIRVPPREGFGSWAWTRAYQELVRGAAGLVGAFPLFKDKNPEDFIIGTRLDLVE